MSIKYAVLGFLSFSPLTGYDLKKLFADSDILYWSGNNNQIYRTLVDLHHEGWVTQEIQPQEQHPARKVYTITEPGRAALREWLLTTPELPQIRNTFLVQLAWADQLGDGELDALLSAYEEEIRVKGLMLRAQAGRGDPAPARTPREAYLWEQITQNRIAFYDNELCWVRQLRDGLRSLEEKGNE